MTGNNPRNLTMRMAICTAALALASLPGCATAKPDPVPEAPPAPPFPVTINPQAPRIYDSGRASLLRNASGMTLQWISWDYRGPVHVEAEASGRWHLTGTQRERDGNGVVTIDGTVTEIGHDYFTFDGEIVIDDTPDAGRHCRASKTWTFAITQNRRYWRLREFEWCDGLTDYIDIYF